MAETTERTYELTPQQWSDLMGRLGISYGAFDDCVAHIGQGYSYSQTYIVNGQNEPEVVSRGFRAVANRGEGAVASVQVRYARGSASPTSLSVTTSDPRIQQEILGLGVQAANVPPISEEMRRMYDSIIGLMRTPEIRSGEIDQLMRRIMEGTDLSRAQPQQAPAAPNEGRDRILGQAGRALRGTAFGVDTPLSLNWAEEYDRRMAERDTLPGARPGGPLDPFTRFHERDYMGPRGGGMGFLRQIGPGGSSSVWIGDRRQYTDFPISERNEFGGGLVGRPAGTLRIYGNLDRPDRFEVITDNAALRAAMERAHIPVRPATEPQPQQPQRQRPGA